MTRSLCPQHADGALLSGYVLFNRYVAPWHNDDVGPLQSADERAKDKAGLRSLPLMRFCVRL